MFSPFLPFCVNGSYGFCEWIHETFCLGVGLWPKGSDSSVLDAVFLQVSLELMACEWWSIVTAQDSRNAMCMRIVSAQSDATLD